MADTRGRGGPVSLGFALGLGVGLTDAERLGVAAGVGPADPGEDDAGAEEPGADCSTALQPVSTPNTAGTEPVRSVRRVTISCFCPPAQPPCRGRSSGGVAMFALVVRCTVRPGAVAAFEALVVEPFAGREPEV